MNVEAIVSRSELVALLGELVPLTIHVGDDGDFTVTEASELTLVPGLGIRIVCKASLHWPLLGIRLPITLHSATVDLIPAISTRAGGDVLGFTLRVEHIDVAAVPEFIDDRITDKVNAELASPRAELAWDFTRTLSHRFGLPDRLEPVDAFVLRVASGDVTITADALTLAVALEANVARR